MEASVDTRSSTITPALLHGSGATVSKTYILHGQLGEGAMGLVYRATDRVTRATVALKQLSPRRSSRSPAPGARTGALPPDTAAREATFSAFDVRMTIVREFQTLASLHHPNVIRVFDFGFDDVRGPYFTMEMLASPRDIVAASADKSLEEKLRLLVQLLRALVYVHRRGILHRDLKPSNVLVTSDSVKVVDFGIAVTATAHHRAAGTMGYIAPEVLLGSAPTAASDLFSVGVLAYQVLSGRFPYDTRSASFFLRGVLGREISVAEFGKTMIGKAWMVFGDQRSTLTSTAGSRRASEPPPAEQVPPLVGLGPMTEHLNRVVMKLLEPSPEHRYASAEKVIDDLGNAFGERMPVDTAETRDSFLKAAEFVGREQEIDTLLGALRDARVGRGSGWLVGGESGVGKSRLLDELRTLALVRNTQVLRAQAATEHARPYQLWSPLIRALAIYVSILDDEASILKDIVPDIAELLEKPVPDAPPMPPPLARDRLYAVVETVLQRHKQPLVLLLEDLQWADSDSLTLLDFVSRAAPDCPLLIVATYRADERPGLPNTLAELSPIQLKRFPGPVVERLVTSMLGPVGQSSELVEFILRETEGNAFFLIEVLRALAEETSQLADVGTLGLPKHIVTGGMNEVIKRRLKQVPRRGLPLLRLAAVAGRQVDPKVLCLASGEQDIGSWLITCANAAVLETQDGWRFTHDKLRERILTDLPADETRTLHRKIADATELAYKDSVAKHPALAYHFRRADLHDKAADYFIRAADESARLYAVVDARSYYAEALSELAILPDTEDLRRRRVDIALRQLLVSWYSVPAARSLALLAEAEDLLKSIDAARWTRSDHARMASVCLWRGRAMHVSGHLRDAVASFAKGLKPAEDCGEAQVELQLKSSMGTSLHLLGRIRDGWPYIRAAVDALNANSPDYHRIFGYQGMYLAFSGEVTKAVTLMESSIERVREANYSTPLGMQYLIKSAIDIAAEDWPLALRDSREGIRIARLAKDLGIACLATGFLEWATIGMGDRAAADEAHAQFADLRLRLGGCTCDDWLTVLELDRALAFGSPEEAASMGERIVAHVNERGNLFAEAVANRSWARALGRTQRYDEAERRFGASVRLSDQEGLLLLSARTHLAWADLCRARGNTENAERHTRLASQLVR